MSDKETIRKTGESNETTTQTNTKLIKDNWYVYIIHSDDNRLYTGISNDPVKRWHAHCHTKQGAKFFRGRKPKALVYLESGFNRSTASQREAALKKLTRPQKNELLKTQSSTDWSLELGLCQP